MSTDTGSPDQHYVQAVIDALQVARWCVVLWEWWWGGEGGTHMYHKGHPFGTAGIYHFGRLSNRWRHGFLAHDVHLSGMSANLEHDRSVRRRLCHHVTKVELLQDCTAGDGPNVRVMDGG